MKVASAQDLEWLWEEIAHAVRQENPLPTALQELSRTHAGTRRGKIARRLGESLARGMTLSDAVAVEGKRLPAGAAAAIEAGERGGQLAQSLQALAENAHAEGSLRASITQAVAYPVVLAFASLGALLFINLSILPQFQEMWDEFDVQLPATTLMLPTFLPVASVALLLLPALTLTVLYLLPAGALPCRRLLDWARVELPVMGGVMRRLAVAQWCGTMSFLVRAGVPEPQAVRLAGESIGNTSLATISQAMGDRLDAGVRLGEAMGQKRFFPPPLTWMVQASEKAGGHQHVWAAAHELYCEQSQRRAYVVSVILRVIFVCLAFQMVALTLHALFGPLIQLLHCMGG